MDKLRVSKVVDPSLLVAGNHVPKELSDQRRLAAAELLSDRAGIPLAAVIPTPTDDSSPMGIASAMGTVTSAAGSALGKLRPDILLLLGDRFEMHALAVAASTSRTVVAHIHGGEESEGALDNLYRHSITKLSHLHFCATELSRTRITQMGEEPWRVHLTGAPALDSLDDITVFERADFLARLQLPDQPFFLATFHPETLDIEKTVGNFEILIQALEKYKTNTIFSLANADEAGQQINERLLLHAASKKWMIVRDNLGREDYFNAMHHASMMIGNSSSGIIEAATFGLPVVNVGTRQSGRERSPNVIDAAPTYLAITESIDRALSEEFLSLCRSCDNIYKRKGSAEQICRILETVELSGDILVKKFALQDST